LAADPLLPPTKLILASSSPRRQELLKRLVPEFQIVASPVEEVGSSLEPLWQIELLDLPPEYQIEAGSHPGLWAWRKAVDVATQLGAELKSIILAADTVVIGEGQLLGKPADAQDAVRMLAALRGRKHYVATGGILLDARDAYEEPPRLFAVVSSVWMRDYSDAELQGYVATGEPLDKAGAYAIQGLGGRLVARVEGCYFNVVGLPLCETRRMLEDVGVTLKPYPKSGYCEFCPLSASL